MTMKNDRSHTIRLRNGDLVDLVHVCTAFLKTLENGSSFPEISEVAYRISGIRNMLTDKLLEPGNDNSPPPDAS